MIRKEFIKLIYVILFSLIKKNADVSIINTIIKETFYFLTLIKLY